MCVSVSVFAIGCSEGGLQPQESNLVEEDFSEFEGALTSSTGNNITYCINKLGLTGNNRDRVQALQNYINQNSISVSSGLEYKTYRDHEGQTKSLHYDVIFHPGASRATPIAIYYHSGGFKKGDRCSAYYKFYDEIRFLLANKVAFATVSYRFIKPEYGISLLSPLYDGKQSLQRIKIRSSSYNYSRNQVALVGHSAGSGIASWLALSDDMRDLNSRWYTPRQSTRVQCAMLIETQATYHLHRWLDYFSEYINSGDSLLRYNSIKNYAAEAYGKESFSDLSYGFVSEFGDKVDMLDRISPDDPKLYLQNTKEPDSLYVNGEVSLGRLLHHRAHIEEFQRVAALKGYTNFWAYKGRNSRASLTKRKSFLRHRDCLNF